MMGSLTDECGLRATVHITMAGIVQKSVFMRLDLSTKLLLAAS